MESARSPWTNDYLWDRPSARLTTEMRAKGRRSLSEALCLFRADSVEKFFSAVASADASKWRLRHCRNLRSFATELTRSAGVSGKFSGGCGDRSIKSPELDFFNTIGGKQPNMFLQKPVTKMQNRATGYKGSCASTPCSEVVVTSSEVVGALTRQETAATAK